MATDEDNNNAGGGGEGGCGGGGVRCITDYVDGRNTEIYRYYLSRRTVLEMLRDRGFEVANSDLTLSLAGFQAVFGEIPNLECLRIVACHRSDSQKKVMVIFMGREEMRKKDVTGILGKVKAAKEKLHGLIMVLQSRMNHFARKELEEAPCKVEVFQMGDLLVNITKHCLQPKMEILTAERKEWLMKKYMARDKQLPRMLLTDPVAKYYGLEKGQVVKITYDGGVIGHLETYRFLSTTLLHNHTYQTDD